MFAILLVDVFLLIGVRDTDTNRLRPVVDWTRDPRVPTITLMASLIVLMLLGTGLVFYLGVTATLAQILLRTVTTDTSRRVDLSLVCGTSVLTLASEVFTVSYYMKVADTVNHASTAIVLSRVGFLKAIAGTRYFDFSSYHILSSVGIQFTGLQPRVLMSVLIIILFQAALAAMYLFVRNLRVPRPVALVATVLLSINIAFLHYGSIVHYQSLSFVFFSLFLLLLTEENRRGHHVLITGPVLLAWTLTHHVTLLMAGILLSLPMAYRTLVGLRRGRDVQQLYSPFLFATFCLIFGAYWVIISRKFRELLIWVFFSSAAAEGLPSDVYLVQVYSSVETLLLQSAPFFVDSLHYSFLLAISLVGIWILLSPTAGLVPEADWRIVLIGFIPAAVLYFPNPAWVPLEGLAEFSRWRLMTLPLLMTVPAFGLVRVTRTKLGSSVKRGFVTVLVIGLVFTTVTSGVTHPGLTDMAGFDKDPREYISDEELSATEFVYAHITTEQAVWSRSDLSAYLQRYAWVNEGQLHDERFHRLTANHTEQRLVVGQGLTIVSVEAFEEQGMKVNLVGVDPSIYDLGQNEQIAAPVSASEYSWERENESVIYSSGPVEIQYKQV
jgi:hypothetical protein